MSDLLPAIEIETTPNPRFSVIWLHGLGADGSDFEPVVPELGLDESCGTRFIFPHAPMIPVTCNGGYVMRAWYDIISLDANNRQIDDAGIVASREAIRRLVEREVARGVPAARVFIAGFSQGGAVAYATALTHPEKLGGVIALSTYIPNRDWLAAEISLANRTTPIFAAHGRDDDVVAPVLGLAARDFLVERGYPVEWHDYAMPHSVCIEEIEAIGQWLRRIMASLDGASERGRR